MEAVPRAPGDLVQHPEVHRPQVADEPPQYVGRPSRPAKPRADARDTLGADPVVADEPRAAVGVNAPRFRLGDVVEEHRQLPDLPSREAAAHRLREGRRDPRVVRRQQAEIGEQRVGGLERAKECSQTVNRWGGDWPAARIAAISGRTRPRTDHASAWRMAGNSAAVPGRG